LDVLPVLLILALRVHTLLCKTVLRWYNDELLLLLSHGTHYTV